jgi:MYXO-CTERM domain-containing protein
VKYALTTALGMMLLLTASGAEANGRFPRGEHLIEYPDGNRMLLAATFGLVVTSDGGKDWHYVCETAFSYQPPTATDQGYSGDPLLALTAEGSLLAGVQKWITKSSDHACGWAKSFEDADKTVDDIAVAPSNRNTAVALIHSISTNTTQVYETTNAGATWAPIGTPLNMIQLGYTIDVDPVDPNHLMVSGLTSLMGENTGVFLNTTNHGMTWTLSSIPKTSLNAAPYIAAVHPTDGKTVFVRTDEWVDDGAGANWASDALLVTRDGGQTWTEVIRVKGMEGGGAKLFGFAVSPDGGTILAGYGDAVEGGGRNVDRSAMGVYRASAPDYAFGADPTAIYVASATCLTWTTRGIYICGSPDGAHKYLAFANDISKVNSAGITKLMETDKLSGEPPCCSGRATTTCDWAVECPRFEACNDAGPPVPPDAAICMMPDASLDAGTGGAGGSAGDAGADRDASAGSGGMAGGAAGAGAAGARPDAPATGGAGTGGASTGGAGSSGTGGGGTGGSGGNDDGCGCRIASQSPAPRTIAGLLVGLLGMTARRRSRRFQQRAA